ncbi:serine protease [Lentzea tibetensis]|uniref:Serine protease n=1 Tax=Lentzea tibetensis TaxID=2591470 RepID=A0A563F0J8_9PSEU|nr:serine protease [Lentzea tibetensis]
MRLLSGILLASAVLLPLSGTAVADDEPSTQVVGGTKASTKDNPFAVFLTRPGKRNSFCGGSIVAPNKVLTAAHCVEEGGKPDDPATVNVVAGRDDERTDAGVVAKVKRLAVHPKYDGFGPDFAVLTLDRVLPYKPISLATSKDSGLQQPGKQLTVLGWGSTQKAGGGESPLLLKAKLPVVPDKSCLTFYGKDDEGIDVFNPKQMICAGDVDGNRDSCFGDSGGPFVASGKLVGVVSFGPPQCAQPNAPAVYGKVSSEETWIKQQILY